MLQYDFSNQCLVVTGQFAGQPINGLAHLAGLFEADLFQSTEEGIWERAIEVNLRSAYRMAAAFQ